MASSSQWVPSAVKKRPPTVDGAIATAGTMRRPPRFGAQRGTTSPHLRIKSKLSIPRFSDRAAGPTA